MALYLSTVIGFTVLLLITLYVATFFLKKALNSKDASKIDPIKNKDSNETAA